MRGLVILISIPVMMVAGCQTIEPIERISFPEPEYTALPTTGTARIQGQAFLKTVGGDVKTAAGNAVYLNPVTSYSEQWYASYVTNRPLDPADPDPRLKEYLRETTADGEGRFEFTDVPAGEYFVTTSVVWGVPTGSYGTISQQGGTVTKRISVKDGETIKIIITR